MFERDLGFRNCEEIYCKPCCFLNPRKSPSTEAEVQQLINAGYVEDYIAMFPADML